MELKFWEHFFYFFPRKIHFVVYDEKWFVIPGCIGKEFLLIKRALMTDLIAEGTYQFSGR